MATFAVWLNSRLNSLNVDGDVFGDYIISIVDCDDDLETKNTSITDLLKDLLEDNSVLVSFVEEILSKWQSDQASPPKENKPEEQKKEIDILSFVHKTSPPNTNTQKQYSAEELRIRNQILNQYSQTEVLLESDDEYDEMEGNSNVQNVIQLQKERREQAKIDSIKKKDKDKEDREKQKALKKEKEEKRKTVKGERKR
ncbi:CCDC43 family protein [Megaselia abdita]